MAHGPAAVTECSRERVVNAPNPRRLQSMPFAATSSRGLYRRLLFPSPIPVQSVSATSSADTAVRQATRIRVAREAMGAQMAKRWDESAAVSFQTAAGHGTAFLAMNDTYGPLFGVSRAEAPAGAREHRREQARRPVHHGHAHAFPCAPARRIMTSSRSATPSARRLESGARRQGTDDRRLSSRIT